jgi:hypothetical protein
VQISFPAIHTPKKSRISFARTIDYKEHRYDRVLLGEVQRTVLYSFLFRRPTRKAKRKFVIWDEGG